MLFLETIVSWKAVHAPSATSVILNTNRVGTFKVRASSYSDFYYSLNPVDRRDNPGFIEATSTVANLKTAFDTVLNSNVMVLKVYPLNDLTATPVNKNIDYADFAYAYAHETDWEKSWVVYYAKGFKRIKVLVNNSLAELIDLAATGTTTSTTTSTTSTTTTTTGA